MRDPRFTKQCRLLQRCGSLAAHDARTPDHLYSTTIHFQQRTQSSFQLLCLSLNQPNLSLSRCCAVLSYPRAARCPCRRRRSLSLPVPRGDVATCRSGRERPAHKRASPKNTPRPPAEESTMARREFWRHHLHNLNINANDNTCARPPSARSRSRYRTCAYRSLVHSRPPPPAAPRRTTPHRAHRALDHTTHK